MKHYGQQQSYRYTLRNRHFRLSDTNHFYIIQFKISEVCSKKYLAVQLYIKLSKKFLALLMPTNSDRTMLLGQFCI